ncbi:MAG TPA: PTS mannose transporter subunit IIAB [Pseudonocardiaceae bacterium]|jgi:mannose/fructose/sorbose-specific phosphotransferase system IIA component|nr:PTS mannose transporter subunit IIAB [Pseudonocardiaceae bacterium]
MTGIEAVPVVLVGHGGLPDGVRDAVEMILGEQERLATVSLRPDGSPEIVAEQVTEAVAKLGGDRGALVLADLMGGSPANAVGLLALRDPALCLVAGLNLAMALEVLTSPAETAAELADVAMSAGQEGVVDVATRLRAAGG